MAQCIEISSSKSFGMNCFQIQLGHHASFQKMGYFKIKGWGGCSCQKNHGFEANFKSVNSLSGEKLHFEKNWGL